MPDDLIFIKAALCLALVCVLLKFWPFSDKTPPDWPPSGDY